MITSMRKTLVARAGTTRRAVRAFTSFDQAKAVFGHCHIKRRDSSGARGSRLCYSPAAHQLLENEMLAALVTGKINSNVPPSDIYLTSDDDDVGTKAKYRKVSRAAGRSGLPQLTVRACWVKNTASFPKLRIIHH